jgi:[ribosomal protein S18]-alanine N-acetyltransferase
MTMKRVETPSEPSGTMPVVDEASLPQDLTPLLKYGPLGDDELPLVGMLRAGYRGETLEQSLEALRPLRPFVQVVRLRGQIVGYVTVERDGPVPGAAYLRNIAVKLELRKLGIGTSLLKHAISVSKDMYRKTLALRVDPANATGVNFYRSMGFTTVATVVSKKSGKLRLLMSREL